MTFYSYLYETYKTHNLEQKGRFLADAIRKANKEGAFLLNKSHWINVALKLLDDPTVPTYYVPIRDVIKCLERGNIDLAIKLYLNPENNEVHNRAGELLNELIDRAQGDERALSQIEETNRLLSIINFIRNIQELKKHGCSTNDIKEFISHNLVERANPYEVEDVSTVEHNLDFISQHDLNTQEDIIQALPHFRKIISNCRSSLLDETPVSQKLEDKILCARFPSDIIKNKDKGINITLTLGLADEPFAEPQSQNMNFSPSHYDKDLRVIPGMNKKVYQYDSVKNLKQVNDAPPKLDEKIPSMKGSFLGRSFKNFFVGSVKNLVESPNVNLQNLHSADSCKISKLDLTEIEGCPKSASLSQLHTKLSHDSHIISPELSDTVNLSFSGSSNGNKLNKTLVLKSDDCDTHEQNHVKSLDESKQQGFMQKFFSRSLKTAVSDDTNQQESMVNKPNSPNRRGGMSMKKMHNIDEEGPNDVSIIDLYETYRQSKNLTQLINSDKVEKDADIFIHAAERLKSWDSLHTLAKDIDNASDVGLDQLTAKDFLEPDATVSLSGDIEG